MSRIKHVIIGIVLPLTILLAQATDLDIPDNIGNLVGNTLTMDLLPNNQGTGYFWVVNPSLSYNPDPDPPGAGGILDVDFSATDLYYSIYTIPSTNITLPSSYLGIPIGDGVSFEITVYVPDAQPEGTYEGWVIAYDQNDPAIRDSFLLKVNVGQQEDVDIIEDNLTGSVDANGTLVYVGSFQVINPDPSFNPDADGPSNTDLYNLKFIVQNLIDLANPTNYILADHIYLSVTGMFGPTIYHSAVIPQLALGDIANVDVYVSLPAGTRTGSYTGQIQVIDDDGWPSDAIGVELTVNPSYDLDISDNTGNLVGNMLTMHIAPPPAGSGEGVGYFVVINPNNSDLNVDPDPFGNADLVDLGYVVDDLVHISNPLAWMPASVVSFEPVAPWGLVSGGSEQVLIRVNVPSNQI
ncbi:MAG: hypothetical protein ABIK10_06345, partial [candidate division WOR-3 bacterium]